MTNANLSGLARALINEKWLTEAEAVALAQQAVSIGEGFVTQLISVKKFKPAVVAEFAAAQFGVPYFDLAALDHDVLPKGLLDTKLITRRRVMALYQRGNRLSIAVSDPTNMQAIDEVKFQADLGDGGVLPQCAAVCSV